MNHPIYTADETERVGLLEEHGGLDTGPDGDFDDLAQLAATVCGAPIGAVTFVLGEQVWIKAAHGIPRAQTPRAHSFCAHAILTTELLVVPDAALDPRFAALPGVGRDGHAGIRFYAGAPLASEEGHALGTLCVVDLVPRTLSAAEARSLAALGRQVERLLALRRALVGERAAHAAEQGAAAERARAEAALREAQERFRSLAESSVDAIVTADSRGHIVGWNPAAARIFGHDPAEVIGQPLELLMPDRFMSSHHGALSRAADGGAQLAGKVRELVGRRRDGSEVPIEITISTWETAEGRFFGAIVRDITDRKVVEQALLADLVARKRAEEALRRARDEAESAARAKSDFLATISHEIRTPLNGILGTAQLLLDTELRPDQRDHADAIRTSTEALFAIVNDVLDFSKLEAGRLELEQITFDPRELFAEATLLFAQQAHAKGLEIVACVDRRMPARCVGDPARVRQILLNLLGNAVKFTHQGEVVLEASHRVTGSAGELRLVVSDSGIGMTEHARGRLFQPFSQADSSTTRKYGGTGLGLAITKRLLDAMGGSIAVESTLHVGTSFTCVVPVALIASEIDPGREWLRGKRAACLVASAGLGQAILEDAAALGVEASAALAPGPQPFDVLIADDESSDAALEAALATLRAGQGYAPPVLRLSRFMTTPAPEPSGRRARLLRRPWRLAALREALISCLGVTPTRELALPAFVHGRAALGRGIDVLLVEDHPINQRVAVGMLAKLGCQSVVVDNGQRAVEALERNSFDLVLMDCYMPIMDGFHATRTIRERERECGRPHTSIVAMTASALAGDRERCLAAGMDEYLTKPLRLDALQTVVGAVTKAQVERAGQRHRTPAAGVDLGIAVVDQKRVNLLSQDLDEWAELVGLYRASVTAAVDEMRSAASTNDSQKLYQSAHKLKGTSANLGFVGVASLCGALERMGADKEHEIDPEIWDRLAMTVKKTLDEVERR